MNHRIQKDQQTGRMCERWTEQWGIERGSWWESLTQQRQRERESDITDTD